jgi:hypothetical protein
MLRSILGIVAGFVVGAVVVGLIEAAGLLFHPLPPGIDLSDNKALREHLAKAPPIAMVPVGIAWFVGPLVGSWLAAIIAGRGGPALAIGVLFLAADITNLISFPHPLWLVIVGFLAPLAAAWMGASCATPTARATRPLPYDMRKKNMAC